MAIPDTANKFNYLFVSDLHIAMGKNHAQRAYYPREDFLYDREFCNFLEWENGHRENKKPWELVIVGDGFDFLPVDLDIVETFAFECNQLANALTNTLEKTKYVIADIFNMEIIPLGLRKMLLEEYLEKNLLKRDDYRYKSDMEKYLNPEMESFELMPDWANEIIESMGYGVSANERKKGKYYVLVTNMELPRWRRSIEVLKFKLSRKFHLAFWQEVESFLLTEEGAKEKLRIIVNGHRDLFAGLAKWVADGNRIVILAGNHDVEIRWPGVQRVFKDLLENIQENSGKLSAAKKKAFRDRIDFKYSWFYYKPGIFYAEHGGQYEPLNSSSNFLEPYEPVFKKGEEGRRRVHLPFGSLGVWLIVARLEDMFPQFEIQGDHSGAVIQFFKKHPFLMIRSAAENINEVSRMAWRTFLRTTGHNPLIALLRSIQMSVIGFLHWVHQGIGYEVKKFFNAYRPNSFPELRYLPYPTEKLNLFSKIALMNPETAKTIYESWYPTQKQLKKCADETGLTLEQVERLYYSWDRPLDLYRLPMFIFLLLFSVVGYLLFAVSLITKALLWLLNPLGGLFLLLITLIFLQWVSVQYKIIPSVWDLIKQIASPIINPPPPPPNDGSPVSRIKNIYENNVSKFVLGALFAMLVVGFKELVRRFSAWLGVKFFYFLIDDEEYILNGAMGAHNILRNMNYASSSGGNISNNNPSGGDFFSIDESSPTPRYYIMGHDHKPMVRRMESDAYTGVDTFFYNTGSWLPWFADQDLRRMRTGGLDNEFTFVKITSTVDKNPWGNGSPNSNAEYLRWNDFTSLPQEQMDITVRKDESVTRLFGGWPGAGIFLGIILGILVFPSTLNIVTLLIAAGMGGCVGWVIEKIANQRRSKLYNWSSWN